MAHFNTIRKSLNRTFNPKWLHVTQIWGGVRKQHYSGTVTYDRIGTSSEWLPVELTTEKGETALNNFISGSQTSRDLAQRLGAYTQREGVQTAMAIAQYLHADGFEADIRTGMEFCTTRGDRAQIVRDCGQWWLFVRGGSVPLGEEPWQAVVKAATVGYFLA